MNRIYLIIRVALFFLISAYCNLAIADKGVFNPKVLPDEIFVGESTVITVSSEIGAEDLHLSSIALFKTDETGELISRLGPMYCIASVGTGQQVSKSRVILNYRFSQH